MAQDKELSQIRGPFRVYPKKKKEEPISTMDEYKQEFIRSLEAYDVRQKKPVRWNFLKDNEGMFQLSRELDPMMKLNEGLYRAMFKCMPRLQEVSWSPLVHFSLLPRWIQW